MTGSQTTRLKFNMNVFSILTLLLFVKQMSCRLQLLHLKGKDYYLQKFHLLKKIGLLKGCAVGNPHLPLLPLPFALPPSPNQLLWSWAAPGALAPLPGQRWIRRWLSLMWPLCSLPLPHRIKTSIAGTLVHSRRSPCYCQ